MDKRVPLYLSLSLILILFSAELTIWGGMRLAYAGGYPDPFAAYEAIMPGKLVTALKNHLCRPSAVNSPMAYCTIASASGPFLSITVSYYNNSIAYLMFEVRDLYVGDLVSLWGEPMVIQYRPQRFTAHWYSGNYDYKVTGERFNYGSPIELVLIGQTNYSRSTQ